MKYLIRSIIKFNQDLKAARKRRFEAEAYDMIHGTNFSQTLSNR